MYTVWLAVKVHFVNIFSALAVIKLMMREYEIKTVTNGPGENELDVFPKLLLFDS